MSNEHLRESLLTCQGSQDNEIRGTILKLSRHGVSFEVYAPAVVLRTSEVLSDLKIFHNDQLIYSGRGVVNGLVATGTATVCEATLEDGWVDMALLAPENNQNLGENFHHFLEQWQQSYRILPECKVVIADIQSFLTELRLWLEQIELGIRSSPSGERIKIEEETAAALGESTSRAITALFEKFERIAEQAEPALQPAHCAFSKRQLHPLLLCSPFLYRTFHKPLGYAGDYEMVNMIMRSPFEGSSLFAKIINHWFLQQPPAEAHRNRIAYLAERINDSVTRASMAGRTARVLSLGCGPALEVQRFIADSPLADRAHFTLLDFNEETLMHARGVLEETMQRFHRKTTLDFGKRSVNQLLKEAARSGSRSITTQFDLVYCAGLFDYLADPVCQRLTNILYDWVAPDGLLITTNVDRSNPRRITMEYVMEWHLNYRTAPQLAALKPAAPMASSTVQSDTSGVNIYFEARKPRSA